MILPKQERKRQKVLCFSGKIDRVRDKLKVGYEIYTQIDSKETALDFKEGKRQLDRHMGKSMQKILA